MKTEHHGFMSSLKPKIDYSLHANRPFYAAFLALCLFVMPARGQSPERTSVALPALSPQAVILGSSSEISVNVKLASTGPEVIPDSVAVLAVDAKGGGAPNTGNSER